MSLTLGEKLRHAREDRGFSLSDVAEQTRISSLYLESIENDDYRLLPGGIFNKGFVKSFAKFVGLDEQEAMADYAALTVESESESFKTYKPEVLTDDRSGSMMPTLVVAGVILTLMTIGILYGLSYLQEPAEPDVAANGARSNINAADANQSETSPKPPPSSAPAMSGLKVEFTALTQPVSLTSVTDGKSSNSTLSPGSTAAFEPKERLRLSYSESLASAVQMTINGKPINLPAEPLNPRRSVIEFEINTGNLAQIWADGAILRGAPATESNANASNPAAPPAPVAAVPSPVRTTPAPRPTVAANTRPLPARPVQTPPASGNRP